jgi:hypothetical protein
MELPPGFSFGEVHKDEIPDLFFLWNEAFAEYALWKVFSKTLIPKISFLG